MASAWAVIKDAEQLLLVQRAPGRGRSGQWCVPGGRIKADESAEDACVREVAEETGLQVEVVCCLADFGDQLYFHCRLITRRSELKLRTRECADVRWVTPQQMLDVGMIMNLTRLQPLVNAVLES